MLLILQATHLENKDDREVVCSEIFVDITGLVDDHVSGGSRTYLRILCHVMYLADMAAVIAAVKLRVPSGTRFYEVLALYFDQVHAHTALSTDVPWCSTCSALSSSSM